MVGFSNNEANGNRLPVAASISVIIFVAIREWPPHSKKIVVDFPFFPLSVNPAIWVVKQYFLISLGSHMLCLLFPLSIIGYRQLLAVDFQSSCQRKTIPIRQVQPAPYSRAAFSRRYLFSKVVSSSPPSSRVR